MRQARPTNYTVVELPVYSIEARRALFSARFPSIEGEEILTTSKSRLIGLRCRKPGMLFQHFGLFPHMPIAENVAFPLKMQEQFAQARKSRALFIGASHHSVMFAFALAGIGKQATMTA